MYGCKKIDDRFNVFLVFIQIALSGYSEVLTWILCSYKENFAMLNRKVDKSTAVIFGNPHSADFEVSLPCIIMSPTCIVFLLNNNNKLVNCGFKRS